MVRLRLDLQYDGTHFHGWAAQPGLRTVEDELRSGLERILRTRGLRLVTAGRTDAGVHARGAVAHVDVEAAGWAAVVGRSTWPPQEEARARLLGVLPPDLVVRSIAPAPPGFDARFSALSRRYRYRLTDDPVGPQPLRRFDTVRHPRPLDVALLNEESRGLLGLHDFASYCRRRDGASTVRTLLEFSWRRIDGQGADRVGDAPQDGRESVIEATVIADAFCHSMVRALVGGVVAVGDGRRAPTWAAQVLAARARHPSVTVMPAHGLSLEEVRYPPEAELAARAAESRTVRALPDGAPCPG